MKQPTKAQIAVLAKLMAANGQFALCTQDTSLVETGVNSGVLGALRDKGLIAAEHVYAYGVCSKDIVVTDAGKAALEHV